jgi:hypothetical protein
MHREKKTNYHLLTNLSVKPGREMIQDCNNITNILY